MSQPYLREALENIAAIADTETTVPAVLRGRLRSILNMARVALDAAPPEPREAAIEAAGAVWVDAEENISNVTLAEKLKWALRAAYAVDFGPAGSAP